MRWARKNRSATVASCESRGAQENVGQNRLPRDLLFYGQCTSPVLGPRVSRLCHAFALGREDTSACQRARLLCSGLITILDTLPKSIATMAVMSAIVKLSPAKK